MKVQDALAQGPLASAQLVAGTVTPEAEVSWVQVVDHPDIESWVQEGHLLLSTGYSWPKDDDKAFGIVEKLAAKKIAGVVLAVPHFLEHFPAGSIRAATQLGLPLLEIAWEVPFSEITQFIHRELVDQQARALARSEQIHRQLTEAAVSGHSLQDVADVLGLVLTQDVFIFSKDGGLVGAKVDSQGTATPSANDIGAALYQQLRQQKTLSRVDSSPTPVTTSVRIHAGTSETNLVIYAARVRDECVGYVVTLVSGPPLSALDLRAVEHAGTVAALQISHQRELSTQEARLGYALVAALIEGYFDDNPKSLERAQLLGWSPSSAYRLCTVLLDEPNPLSRDGFAKRETVAHQIKLGIERLGHSPLISLSANQVHVLLPEQVDTSRWWSELKLAKMALAVSQTHTGVAGMAACGKEAAELMALLKPGGIHHYDQMLLPRVLAGDSAARRAFLDRVLTPLDADTRNHALLDTAMALSKEGFHLQKSAERLGVHISTLRYRLEKLQAQTGLDLESADGRFQLQLATQLYLLDH